MSAPKNSIHNLQVELKRQQAGLSVFVAGPDKKPRVKWRDVSTSDPDQIKEWFKQWPDALPAVDLAKSGHIILDGDRHGGPDGVAAVEQLFAERSLNAAAIPTIITPQDGRHYWFMQPTEGEPLGDSDKPIRDKAINVRGAGGYVIAPGTRLPDGRPYKRDPSTPSALEAVQTGTVPVLPPAIEKLLRGNGGHSAEMPALNGATYSPTSLREESYARTALNSIAHKIASTPPNTGRNNELNNGAITMGHMVAAGWIARAILQAWPWFGAAEDKREQAELETKERREKAEWDAFANWVKQNPVAAERLICIAESEQTKGPEYRAWIADRRQTQGPNVLTDLPRLFHWLKARRDIKQFGLDTDLPPQTME